MQRAASLLAIWKNKSPNESTTTLASYAQAVKGAIKNLDTAKKYRLQHILVYPQDPKSLPHGINEFALGEEKLVHEPETRGFETVFSNAAYRKNHKGLRNTEGTASGLQRGTSPTCKSHALVPVVPEAPPPTIQTQNPYHVPMHQINFQEMIMTMVQETVQQVMQPMIQPMMQQTLAFPGNLAAATDAGSRARAQLLADLCTLGCQVHKGH